MTGGPKITEPIKNRRQVNLVMQFVRDKLLGTKRIGIDREYMPTSRFADQLSARDQVVTPHLPGGVHHKLSHNYYYGRDGRRSMIPVAPVYNAAGGQDRAMANLAAPGVDKGLQKGPDVNFGLPSPTPGFGIEMVRKREAEEDWIQMDSKYDEYAKYDKYEHKSG